MNNKTLLVVDDEIYLFRSLKRLFEDEDYEILTATNAENALNLLSSKPIQVIISDQQMPNMTGSEFFTRVKQEYPRTIRILLSGYTDFESLKNAINHGDIYKFLAKPWDNDILKSVVKDAFQAFEHKNKSDATIRKETDAEIKRLKDEFLANISHEIRTPLNCILGFSELLNNGSIDSHSSEYKEFLNDILSSSQSLSKILINALDLLQAEPGKMEFHAEIIDIASLINEVIKTFQSSINDKKITIETNVNRLHTSVITDPTKLAQVLSCLISNAIKFSHLGGKVEIEVQMDNEVNLKINVIDYGIGIAKDDMERLFKPFQQLDMGAGKRYGGVGVGLALAQRIVELQGGSITVNSKIGKGSIFCVLLPCKSASNLIKQT